MVKFVFTKKSEKTFKALPKSVQERIIKKLKDLKNHQNIFLVIKRLHQFDPATHRLRIGSHRVILALTSQNQEEVIFRVLDLGDRKGVYR